MIGRALKLAFVTSQVLWMLVVLPGHVRGQITRGGDSCCVSTSTSKVEIVDDSCCKPKQTTRTPSDDPDRRARCAVCYQALGYDLPPVYDFDVIPTGLCELRRLIEPSKRHLLLCDPVHFANRPPGIV